jgi:hypothetical protein
MWKGAGVLTVNRKGGVKVIRERGRTVIKDHNKKL